jgi:hypothetical protein
MRKRAMPDKIEKTYESDKKRKPILLKNKQFFCKKPDRSVSNAVFFCDSFIPVLSRNALYGIFTGNFFEQFGGEQWQY